MPAAAPVQFDTAALDLTPTHDELDEVRRAERAERSPRFTWRMIATIAFSIVLLAMFAFIGTTFARTWSLIGPRGGSVFGLFPIALLGLVAAIGIFTIVNSMRLRRRALVTRWRLTKFAEANGMTYSPRQRNPAHPGLIFSRGSERVASDLVRSTHPRFVEYANYSYTTGSGKDKRTHSWGYVAIRLNAPLPHIVLDAKGNNGLFGSNLGGGFTRDQRLSLEGDFDTYFTLYCPREYERDALYLFSPDMMARFVDNAAALDIEIIDDWMFLYTHEQVSTLSADRWRWLLTTMQALTLKLDDWGRWRDERLAPPAASTAHEPEVLAPVHAPTGVAAGGRRLKRSATISWATIVTLVAMALFVVFRVVS